MPEWRTIPGFDGHEVSDDGQVRNRTTGRVLTGNLHRSGYLLVGVTHTERLWIHQAVAAAFIGPRPPGHVVRHLDGNPTNNAVANLAYGTPSDNMWDAVRHGTHANAAKTHCKRGHEFTPENTYINPDGARCCRTCIRARQKGRRRRGRDDLRAAVKTATATRGDDDAE